MSVAAAKKPVGERAVPVGPRFQNIINRGKLPFERVPFPRYDDEGKPVEYVRIRVLSQFELDNARANAAAYVAECLDGKRKAAWRPEELEDNAVLAEIMAVACRDPDDPEQKFFPYGVIEARQCSSDELAMLFRCYNDIREKAYPTLSELTEAQMEALLSAMVEDADKVPFWQISPSRLAAFSVWAATSLASARQLLIGLMSNISPASPSSEQAENSDPSTATES